MSIKWEEPPPMQRRGRVSGVDVGTIQSELLKCPMEWAVIFESQNANGAAVCASRMRRDTRWVGFEAIARGVKVYARYVGEAEEMKP